MISIYKRLPRSIIHKQEKLIVYLIAKDCDSLESREITGEKKWQGWLLICFWLPTRQDDAGGGEATEADSWSRPQHTRRLKNGSSASLFATPTFVFRNDTQLRHHWPAATLGSKSLEECRACKS